ncbi:MAG: fibrobacter succinogenes major paralogous domain-containing protein [Fibrobacter sp.]|nr:fibrobacter succinogenes major paralogous domain-containing protein [Fibrobacter sp.]
MTFKKLFAFGLVAAVLVACGDDSSSNSVTNAGEDSSSSVIASDAIYDTSQLVDLVELGSKEQQSGDSKSSSSSEKAKSSSSAESSSSGKSSSSETSVSSSSSAKSSSSEKKTDSSSSTKSSSSSSVDSSSSSAKSSSSSVAYVEPCRTDSVDTCEYGTLTDERDGQTYKTVKIGTQTWMAKNLNYAYLQPTAELDSSSFCYRDSVSYCEKYGRLYSWDVAINICPDGWHLPDTTEWNTLFAAVGGSSTAGKMLKSTSGWKNSGNGTDAYSFAVLPAGYGDNGKTYDFEGSDADFWSSTEDDSGSAYDVLMNYHDDVAYLFNLGKRQAFSVRCVKDE